MKSKLVAAFAGAVALGFVILAAEPVVANTIMIDTPVKQYTNHNGQYSIPVPDTLIVGTASDAANKGAGFAVHITDLDSTKPGDDILLGFMSADDWGKFVQLWKSARAIKITPNMAEIKIGDYFDSVDQVLLHVNVNDEGIELAVVGQDNGHTAVTLFQLVPAQFDDFDASVASVSAYFGNGGTVRPPDTSPGQPAPPEGQK
jgi:hypothetical protein